MKKFIIKNSTLLFFVIICIILSLRSDYFLTGVNLKNVVKQSSIIGIMACGLIPVLLSGNIDISIGALMALSGALSAILFSLGLPLFIVFCIPVLTTMLIS